MGRDYYGLLGINHAATLDDIQRAYRRLALRYHPYRYKGPKGDDIFYYIAEAYDVLSSPKYKSLYDQYGEEGIKFGVPQPPKPDEAFGPWITYTFHGDPYKVFREFFGVDNPFAELKLSNVDPEYKFCPIPEEKPVLGASKTFTFPITLEDRFYGCKKTMHLRKCVFDKILRQTVEEDQTLEFTVPVGCPDGRKFIFPGASDQGRNIIPGDVIFVANYQPHDKFEVQGNDLIISETIPVAHALTGCIVDITTFEGKVLHLPITRVTKPNDRIEIANEGLPLENSKERGKFVINFQFNFPDHLSRNQKQAIKNALLQNLT